MTEPSPATSAARTPTPRRPPVIGLAGGIGSGKSEVAKFLAAKGAVVSDSDTQAKALLREPGIADVLTRWWGDAILGTDKLPDRARLAAIVFKDPAQRKRLEDLIHPILHSQRRRAILNASKTSPPAPLFIIDAPLLFEAGLHRECDAVIFVDAPRAAQLERVKANRGWTDEELARREAAQLPLDAKKSRSDFMIENADDGQGSSSNLKRQIDELWPLLTSIRPTRRRRA
ncbi:MAG: dephospho-CoA kinase [Phycisphaerales bacterium]